MPGDDLFASNKVMLEAVGRLSQNYIFYEKINLAMMVLRGITCVWIAPYCAGFWIVFWFAGAVLREKLRRRAKRSSGDGV